METQALVAEYVRTGSEPAFRELVSRYLSLVHSSALRLVGGDAQLAEDVSQTVFLHLARKAHRLPKSVMLGGWLHRDTCYVARTLMRGERRRQKREREAVAISMTQDHSESNLAGLAPVLDEAIEELRAEDRRAILLRFFEQTDFRTIGEMLGSNEDAARKRVMRAVEKLHGLLTGRGVSLSAAALGTVLATEAATAAPSGLAAIIAGSALAGVATGGGLSFSLVKAATMTKIQAGVLGAAVLVGAAASVVIQRQAQAALRAQDESLSVQSAEMAKQQAENGRLKGLAQGTGSRVSSLADLLSLRSEIESLREQTNRLAAIPAENRRLRAANLQQANATLSILRMQEGERELGIARMNYTRQWLLAFIMFANDHGNQFPTSFDDAREYVGKEMSAETNVTEGQFEILYRGSITNITSPARTVVLRERQPRVGYDGKPSRAYGFSDGHSELTRGRNGNFDAWERQHIIPP